MGGGAIRCSLTRYTGASTKTVAKGGRCSEGHEGVACRVCESGFYYSAVESKCVECGSLHAHPLAIASGICLILLLVASIYVFRRRRPDLFAKVVRAAEENLKAMAMDAGSEDVDVIDEGLGGMAQPVALSGPRTASTAPRTSPRQPVAR